MVRGQRRVKAASKGNGGDHVYLNGLPMVVQRVKITNFFQSDINGENKEEDIVIEARPCIRMSPRKHPSTLSVLQQQNNNNTPRKSPHKIEINYDAVIENLTGIVSENHALTPQPPKKQQRVQIKNLQEKEPSINNCPTKLTDFFPVRRSVRKTKKAVQEEKKRELELCVINQKEDGLKVKNFDSKGRGVIATKRFAKGDYVVEYAGDLISVDEAKEREEQYANDSNTGCYMYYFLYRNTQMCVDATAESERLGRLVNHSRQGNLMTKIIEVASKPHLVLIAKEDIPEGRELTYDYGDRSKESLKYHPWLAF